MIKATKDGVVESAWAMENRVSDAEKFAGGYMPMAYHPDGWVGGGATRQRAWGGGYIDMRDQSPTFCRGSRGQV